MTRDSRAGFALLSALWAVTLLSTIALALGIEQRSRRLVALNHMDRLGAHAAADAGLAHGRAILGRLAGAAETLAANGNTAIDPWVSLNDITLDTFPLGDGWYRIRFEDPSARVHLNRAEPEEVARLLVALRVDARVADSLSQSIADWRDSDDARRARGAEMDAYLAAQRPLLPTDAPFRSVDELRHVIGVTPELFTRIEPYVTVLGSGRIALHAAPPEVLLSLPGMTPEAALVVLTARRDGRRFGHVSELGPMLSGPARTEFMREFPRLVGRLALESAEMVVRVEAGAQGGPMRIRGHALLIRSTGLVHMLENKIE